MPTITNAIQAASDHAQEASEILLAAAQALGNSDPLAARMLFEQQSELTQMAGRLESSCRLAKDTPACQQEIR